MMRELLICLLTLVVGALCGLIFFAALLVTAAFDFSIQLLGIGQSPDSGPLCL